ncbi:MAG: UDP-N-acetylmuramate dehydrogenase [Chitinophagaceae bacterium]|nr:UDP-N-acetylmuramate dehydrogenase [Chitinophagaceae bacterium]
MQLQQNISLLPYNTFGIEAYARWFAAFSSLEELQELNELSADAPQLILGGGSNILFTDNVNGMVWKNELRGIELTGEDANHYYVKVQAGENWHRFVQYCVEQGYAGLENLSLIPGNTGASPMQNIGAYGVEIKDVFHELEAYHLKEKTVETFRLEDCAFGYRESVFKKKYRNQFVILNVSFRLNKTPVFHTGYGAIVQELENMKVQDLSIRAVSEAVIRIRSSKLPDPSRIGNAGSFFKNPVISKAQFLPLQASYPSIMAFPADNDQIKLAAGWLIEQCGWKGYRKGDAGCYEKQALVLVNYGNASGAAIYDLSAEIIDSVLAKFGVQLEREVNII